MEQVPSCILYIYCWHTISFGIPFASEAKSIGKKSEQYLGVVINKKNIRIQYSTPQNALTRKILIHFHMFSDLKMFTLNKNPKNKWTTSQYKRTFSTILIIFTELAPSHKTKNI